MTVIKDVELDGHRRFICRSLHRQSRSFHFVCLKLLFFDRFQVSLIVITMKENIFLCFLVRDRSAVLLLMLVFLVTSGELSFAPLVADFRC